MPGWRTTPHGFQPSGARPRFCNLCGSLKSKRIHTDGPRTFRQAFEETEAQRGTYCENKGTHKTPLGPVTKIQVGRYDGKRLNWEQIWKIFAANFPGEWAIEVFPPGRCLVNEVNAYHLWVIHDDSMIECFRIDNHDLPTPTGDPP